MKAVKLIVGVYVMVKISETDDWNVFDATLPLIAHQYRRSWEDPGIVKMFMMMMKMMEYYEGEKIQESFYQFSKMLLDIASCWT